LGDIRNRKGQNPGGTTLVTAIQICIDPRGTLPLVTKAEVIVEREDVLLGKGFRDIPTCSDWLYLRT
jgi:hypothetical protein